MVIDAPTAKRFIQAYMSFLGSMLSEDDKAGQSTIQWLTAGRSRFVANRSLLATYRAAHPQADADMLDAIGQLQMGRWVYLKDTRSYSVVLDMDATRAYAVLGLTQRLRNISADSDGVGGLGRGLIFDAALVPLNGHWVCDGLIQAPIWLGPRYRNSYTASYQALRQNGQFSFGPKDSP